MCLHFRKARSLADLVRVRGVTARLVYLVNARAQVRVELDSSRLSPTGTDVPVSALDLRDSRRFRAQRGVPIGVAGAEKPGLNRKGACRSLRTAKEATAALPGAGVCLQTLGAAVRPRRTLDLLPPRTVMARAVFLGSIVACRGCPSDSVEASIDGERSNIASFRAVPGGVGWGVGEGSSFSVSTNQSCGSL